MTAGIVGEMVGAISGSDVFVSRSGDPNLFPARK